MSEGLDIGRFELKYAVPEAMRHEIRKLTADHTIPDPHGAPLTENSRGYHVHSLYLDTPGLDDYNARLGEYRIRHRTRIRTYGTSDSVQPVYLENKRKLDTQVIKHRVRICDTTAWNACTKAEPWTALWQHLPTAPRATAHRWVRLVAREGRIPVSVVHYRREVYVDPLRPQVRLTLDRHVQGAVAPAAHDLYASPTVNLLDPEWMVLELKFDDDKPAWMRTLCRTLGLSSEPVSKFGLSVAHGVRAGHARELLYLTPRALRPLRAGAA